MPLSQPGRDYDSENSERIGKPRWLLGLAGGTAHHRDGDLLEAQLVLEGFEDDLVGVEPVLAQVHLVELRDPYGAVAVRAVGDLHAGEQRDHAREEHHPSVTGTPSLLVVAYKTGAEHEVRLALYYGLYEAVEFLRLVLPVGVEVGDALAPVDDVGNDRYALGPGYLRRRVVRAVVHDHRLHLVAEDLGGDTAQHTLNAALLVLGGHDYKHLTRVSLGPLLGREVLLGVLPYGEAGDDLAAAAARLPHPAQEVQIESEEQQYGDREQCEATVLEAEQPGEDPTDLRDDRDQGHARGDE